MGTMKRIWMSTVCTLLASVPVWGMVEYPAAKKPGAAENSLTEAGMSVSNNLINLTTDIGSGGRLRFGGVEIADAKGARHRILASEGELFTLQLANGKALKASEMRAEYKLRDLEANAKAIKLSERVAGKALSATFRAPDGSLQVEWQAELRDGSHYVRQVFTIKALKDVAFASVVPMQYMVCSGGEPSVSGNTTHGTLVVNEKMFLGLETPMSVMRVGGAGKTTEAWQAEKWSPEAFQDVFGEDVPKAFVEKYGEWCRETSGPVARHVKVAAGEVEFAKSGECKVTFRYEGGNHRLNMIGVALLDAAGKPLSTDAHPGHTGDTSTANTYTVQVPQPGKYTIQYWVETRTESITSRGAIELSLPLRAGKNENPSSGSNQVQGEWVRKTTLAKGQSWQVSSVIGLLAPGQARRSFLAYSERERAVPYRSFVHYNDWYEVGIRLHDNDDPLKRTSEKIWLDILKAWDKELYKKRKTRLDAFVIDDGWDDFNSLWDFHAGFPSGFAAISRAAGKMKAGIGTWLGPVGGYGKSKRLRLEHWNKKHPNNKIGNFELSNKEYFNAFVGRCREMIRKYDMRYFKFDGISAKFHAKGPAGLEDAEGIISVICELRKARADVFINATVGTWASPFWFHYADSIWRQENDFGSMGNMGDERDRWITYRDRLVYEVFVQGAPFCPINSLMTHGTIITRNGPPAVMSKEPANCIKEMRAAFGCGSGLQEVYADTDLMNQENGRLWDELAACISWVRRHADVLDDVHWVGGNPWNGKDGDVYGWAAWNRKKCTLTLRNSSNASQTLRTTLRALFEVPKHLKGSITLSSSFADQRKLPGVVGQAVDVDQEIELTLEPMEVLVMEGSNELNSKKK